MLALNGMKGLTEEPTVWVFDASSLILYEQRWNWPGTVLLHVARYPIGSPTAFASFKMSSMEFNEWVCGCATRFDLLGGP